MINLVFSLLVVVAIIVSLLTFVLLVTWLRGADSLAFPGLGIIVATPLFALLLTVLQFLIIIAAIVVARYRTDLHTIMSV